jgi:hypothetical protein
MYFVRDAVEIPRLLAGERRLNLLQLIRDSINCFIRQIFGLVATTTCKDLDQSSANLLVPLTGRPEERRRILRSIPIVCSLNLED